LILFETATHETTMIPDHSGIDCATSPVDYYTWDGFLGDAWIIIPFLMGMFFYKLFNGINIPLMSGRMAAAEDYEDEDDCCCKLKPHEMKRRFEEAQLRKRSSSGCGNDNPALW
jgi:hypothetical protein